MKFLSFRHGGAARFGALVEGGVVDLGTHCPDFADLRAAIRAGALGDLAQLASRTSPDFSLADIDYLPTIPNPEKVICIGVNYANRNEEYKDGSKPPQYPSVFMRTRESLVDRKSVV